MISARSLIDAVSLYLRDHEENYEFNHWTEPELANFLQLAVKLVSSTKPSLFTTKVELKLVPGAIQSVPDSCEEFVSVAGQITVDGGVVPVRKSTSTLALNLNRPICTAASSSGDYVVSAWRYDPDDYSTIYVDPPVPAGTDATLSIRCYNTPTIDSADANIKLPSHWEPALFELMLYYAYGVDIESVPNRDRSAVHWNNAVTIMAALGANITTAKRKTTQGATNG